MYTSPFTMFARSKSFAVRIFNLVLFSFFVFLSFHLLFLFLVGLIAWSLLALYERCDNDVGKGGTDVIDRSRFTRTSRTLFWGKTIRTGGLHGVRQSLFRPPKPHRSLLFVPSQKKVKKRLKVTWRLSVRLDPPSKHRFSVVFFFPPTGSEWSTLDSINTSYCWSWMAVHWFGNCLFAYW